MAIALVHPLRYKELLSNSVGRVAVYVIIAVAVSVFGVIPSAINLYGVLDQYYKEYIPNFTLQDSVLNADDVFDLSIAGTRIMIDTTKQLTSENFEQDRQGMLFDSDSVIVKSGAREFDIKYSDISEINGMTITKEWIYSRMGIVKSVIVFAAIITIVLSGAGFMLRAVIIALLSLLFSSMSPTIKMRLSFGQTYKLALYSAALPVLLSLVLGRFFGGMEFIGFIISVIFVNIATMKPIVKYDKNDTI